MIDHAHSSGAARLTIAKCHYRFDHRAAECRGGTIPIGGGGAYDFTTQLIERFWQAAAEVE